ncbi:UDP-4-amino-4,6-dideoxy-N-acetyl-beta-L-altrosamine N-acetyltransferase [Aneurinibacillus sp. Ricciae_BoGa-3]|uniref:UDP-4-amino-4, 6-dideoxy-N-acetyl-beta-L-altrosamine N-acetyltransferase n=1 Tax=Aneurinibacillus sp. Ricciae_BoGa-3 TaxID=3022697 RepID=UPI002341C13E|nr:UDP-4-amino-4,6-dideoxy-N-acetyl-beta-L-altrosamine N-acetyltransferase [Aneurinibacillus sp. Ricciae_BoGa-3]WCK54191.1 UDP-4-amino-4,6-dideoxy-N-acetyl-beta-L-altrosamine N-acetyltransferase [Aneurinibacillus sp. Ricciae_BoGa-3]
MVTNKYYKLRLINENDLKLILSWRNSEKVRRNMFTDHEISIDEHRNWFQNLEKNNTALYLIFEIDNQPRGLVSFSDIDYGNKNCLWGFYLGQENLPKGTGYIMGCLGLHYAFTEMKMRKVCGEVFNFNKVSINYHKKLGFKEEGYFKKHVLKNGQYEDIVCFALFSDQWESKNL